MDVRKLKESLWQFISPQLEEIRKSKQVRGEDRQGVEDENHINSSLNIRESNLDGLKMNDILRTIYDNMSKEQ